MIPPCPVSVRRTIDDSVVWHYLPNSRLTVRRIRLHEKFAWALHTKVDVADFKIDFEGLAVRIVYEGRDAVVEPVGRWLGMDEGEDENCQKG